MFTGIVESMGAVVAMKSAGAGRRLVLRSAWPATSLALGESIAVDGVCLTVAGRRRPDRFEADVVAETLSRSTLGSLTVGERVNLERSLAVGERLGGHMVLGHVDGTVSVRRIARARGDWRLRLALPADLARYVALKGSVTLQGVSLTVAAVGAGTFDVALVPQTLERTTLGSLRVGHRLNLEVDVLARYLERLTAAPPASRRRGAVPRGSR